MAIEIHPDSTVMVVAPEEATAQIIQSKVEKRSPWIAKQLRFFSRNGNGISKPEWVSGESVYYLGRHYRLRVQTGQPDVKLAGKYLYVLVRDRADKIRISVLVNAWYLQHARMKYEERLKRLDYILQREKVRVNSLIIRKLEKRWGSCTRKGNIVLNSVLIKARVHCIDYVLIHEICHLKYHHHGPKFRSMLAKYCPDWWELKAKLEASPR